MKFPRRLLFRIVLSLLFAMIFVGALFAGAEHGLSLRIVDAKTGKPIKRVSASVVMWNESGQIEVLSHGKTDAEGVILFHLSDPLPERVGFDFSPNELKYCSDLAFPTAEILNVGLVAQNKCQTEKGQFRPKLKAGEITLFAQRVSLSERMRKEIP